jgi:hypothetical protein
MHTEEMTVDGEHRKAKLSTLWIFIMFNMVFADIFSFMYPGLLKQIMSGMADQTKITPEFLLIAALVTEIPIAMVFLARLLRYGANRWMNIFAGIITILWVIGGGSFTLHYIFFATIEIVCSLVIVWFAWKWKPEDALALGK